MDVLNETMDGIDAMMAHNVELNAKRDNSKILAMLVLGIGSFLFGLIPTCLSRQSQRSHPLLISILLCFGAGVLLSTAIVHMLADVSIFVNFYIKLFQSNAI